MTKLYIVTQNEIDLPDFTFPYIIQLNPDADAGRSISQKQKYSELRAHYWVWKNEPPDTNVVGFFQFRRYLDLSEKNGKLPYTIRKCPEIKDFSLESIDGWDIIAPMPEYTGESVCDRYGKVHRRDDLNLVFKIIKEKHPRYVGAAEVYLYGKSEYYGNLYIMRRDIFDNYCAWLFEILEEYDLRAKNIPDRTQGYLAERLFGIWFTKLKSDGVLRWREVPRVHFWCYDDDKHHLRRDMMVNLILPPGSKRRVLVKKFL